MTLALSVLDLSPIGAGSNSSQALQNTFALARLADRLGYTRYWLAEHHNMPGLASTAPEILIGHVASETKHIRVGSGGIMLPNHVPLKVVETFHVLEALHPGRIDLGIGRAPGTDALTAYALRKNKENRGIDDFPQQINELLAFAEGQFPEGHPFQTVHAMPNDVPLPPIWLLGSSDYSARVAATLGVGFAFAHHINPHSAIQAVQLYRQDFTPSVRRQQPYAILALSAICAETEAAAQDLAASQQLMWLRLHSGRPGPLPSLEEAKTYPYTPAERAQIHGFRSRALVGDPSQVYAQILALVAQTGADEVMVTTMVHNHAARLHSYELLAEASQLRTATDTTVSG